jgi:hypothetical protein
LAKWVSTALQKALSEKNIKSGFRTIGIFPFNPHAMDEKMGPSEFYREVPTSLESDLHTVDLAAPESLHTIDGTFVSQYDFTDQEEEPVLQAVREENFEVDAEEGYESEVEEDYLNQLEVALAMQPEEDLRSPRSHFYVPAVESELQDDCGWGEEIGFSEHSNDGSIDRFLVLPHEDIPAHDPLPEGGEPQIDYSRSHILTSDEYVASLEAKAARKQALLEEARVRKIASEDSKERRKLQKLEKMQKAKERTEKRAANKREKDYWEQVKRNGWGDKLHEFIKASAQNPALSLRTPHNLAVPPICRYNQKIAMLRSKFKAEGKDPRLVIPAVNVSQYMRDQAQWSGGRGFSGNHGPW